MPHTPDHSSIYEVIRTAHRIASTLLEELADTSERDTERRTQLLAEVERALAVHARTEDAVFYDLLLRNEQTRALVEKAQQEHDAVLRLLDDLHRAQAGGEAWDDMMAELTATVADHIEEEETELFPAMEQLLDDDQAHALARTFQAEQSRFEGEQPDRERGPSPEPSVRTAARPFVPTPAAPRRSDASIADDIHRRLAAHPELDTGDIEVRVVDGEVTLAGVVDARTTKYRAEALVEDIPGVTDVYNLVAVRGGGGSSTNART